MNAAQHGLPQRRVRLYMVAVLRGFSHRFRWPKRVPLKITAQDIIYASASDNARRLPPKGASLNAWRQRALVKLSHAALRHDGVRAHHRLVFTDIGCTYARAMKGTVDMMPTLTATRCAALEYWVSLRGGRISLEELMRFQGVEPEEVANWRLVVVALACCC